MIYIYNYDNEISVPEEVALRKFLWADYFHDSIISDISFNDVSGTVYPNREILNMKIHCDRDCEKAMRERIGQISPKIWYEELFCGRHTYVLTFYGVRHMEMVGSPGFMIYLNGRFKDTQTIRELSKKEKKIFYHFRIQITGGYLDIIFNRFKIRKTEGRVNYSLKGYSFKQPKTVKSFSSTKCYTFESMKESLISKKEKDDIFKRLQGENFDDWDCFLDLEKLYKAQDPDLLKYIRSLLAMDVTSTDAKPYGAYLLGKIGEKSDLELVRKIYFQTENALQQRSIMDAIELLQIK